jgi:hypothetical protein
MFEFRNLLNTFAQHVTAANVESFIKLTEHLITLSASLAVGATNPVAGAVEILSAIGDVVISADPSAPVQP